MGTVADLTLTKQRSYTDKDMNFHVADMLNTFHDVLADISERKVTDLTELLDKVRTNPDFACAAVLAALCMIPATPKTLALLRMQAGAIRRYQPDNDDAALSCNA